MSFVRVEPGEFEAKRGSAHGVYTICSPNFGQVPVAQVPRDTETVEDRKSGPVSFPLPDLDDYYTALRGLAAIFEQLRVDHAVAQYYGNRVLSTWETRAYGAVAHSDHLRLLLPRMINGLSTRKRLSLEAIFRTIDSKCQALGLEIHMAAYPEDAEPYFERARRNKSVASE